MIRLAIVGCGRIAQSYFEALHRVRSVKLCAAVDPIVQTAPCPVFDDLESCLKEVEFDAAIICTPPNTHCELSCRLLESGKHVLCEKPLATTLADGVKMMQMARQSRKSLMMASKFRYVDDLIVLKEWIGSGKIGRVLHYENCFSGNVDMTCRWNAQPQISGGGVLIDNGSHSVDVVRYLLGPIQSVRARNISVDQKALCEDCVELCLIAREGVPGIIYLSWNSPFGRPGYVSLYGSEGRIRACWDKLEYRTDSDKEWRSFGKGYHKIDAFSAKVQNFANVISGTETPMISETDSLASVAVIEAAYQSLKSGKWEDVIQDYR